MIIDEVIDVCERPIIFSAPMIRAILEGKKIQTRRVVKAPVMTARDGTKACGKMLFDLSRAFADHGFPTDDNGEVFPMERWLNGSDPAPESAYRYHYLHVPIAHPQDGWEANPRDDRQMRVYCPHGQPGDRLWVRETWAEDYGTKDHTGRDPDAIWYRADGQARFCDLHERTMTGEVWDAGEREAEAQVSVLGGWSSPIHMPRWVCRLTLEIESVRVERLQEICDDDAFAEGIESYVNQGYRKGDDGTARGVFRKLWDSINAKSDRGWDANPWVWVIAFKSL